VVTPLHLILDGTRIHDIPSFYAEVNRVFMAGLDWQLGPSLDALHDMLHGDYGALEGHAAVTLTWTAFEQSRAALGADATRAWLLAKLAQPGFDTARIRRQFDALEAGQGQTYFDIVLEVIAAHPNITLVPA
jgi:RNAse (barnase) inhibitor barstar